MGNAGFRACMQIRDFRRMLQAMTVSFAGDYLYGVALVVVVLERSGDPAYVAALLTLRLLPAVVIGPLAGVLADRVDRVHLMVGSDLIRLVCMIVLGALVATGASPVWLIAVAVVASCAGSAFRPAFMATLPSVLREDQLASGNALISAVEYVAIVAGPLGSAALLASGHDTIPFFVNAATFAISASSLFGLRHPPPTTTTTSSEQQPGPLTRLRVELGEGITALGSDRNLALLCWCLLLLYVSAGFEAVYLVLVSDRILGLGTAGVGLLDAAFGIGGVIAIGLAARLARSARPGLVLAAVVLLCGTPMTAFTVISQPALGLAVMVLGGVASVILDVVLTTTLQRVVAPERLARCEALLGALARVGMIVGSVLAPVALSGVGLRPSLLLASLVPTTLSLLALTRTSRMDGTASAAGTRLGPLVSALRATRVFADVPVAALERLASEASEESAAAGQLLLREGDLPDDLLVLLSGSCQVSHRRGAERVLVVSLTAPDVLGEIGLLRDMPRSADVTASSTCTLLRVPGQLFRETVLNPGTHGLLLSLAELRIARSGSVR